MPRAVATCAELEQKMLAARREFRQALVSNDLDAQLLAETRWDELLDRWMHQRETA